jgi:hypothetical protein
VNARTAVIIATLAVGCGQPRVFPCDTDTQCVLDHVPGRCEVTGFCSFPDIGCASGSRFGEHAPVDIAGTCVEQPSNDRCEMALPLATAAIVTGELRGGDVSGLLTCSPLVDADVFYAVTLDDCSDVSVHAEAATGNLAVGLVSTCTGVVGCQDAFQTAAGETLQLYGVPAGDYQIAVGGVDYDADFALSMAVADPPANDTCANALDLDALTGPVPTQSFARTHDDVACDTRTGGRDVFYKLSLAKNSVIDVAVNPPSADFAISLRDGCDVERACSVVTGPTTRFHDVPAGEHELAIDGPADGTCGRFDVAVTTKEVVDNNRCEHAALLTLGTPVIADLDHATGEYTGSCGGSGDDVVYEFELTHRSHVLVDATARTGGFRPVIYVRAAQAPDPACETAAEVSSDQGGVCGLIPPQPESSTPVIACDAAVTSHAQLDLEELPAGHYQVFVDSEDGNGTLDLLVQVARPIGDDINSPAPLGGVECFDIGGCCDITSTVSASPSSYAGCGIPAGRPGVFRSIEIPPGYGLTGRATIYSPTPVQAIARDDCSGAVVTYCGSTPTAFGNLWLTFAPGVAGTLNPDNTGGLQSCHITFGVFAADNDLMADQLDLRFVAKNVIAPP